MKRKDNAQVASGAAEFLRMTLVPTLGVGLFATVALSLSPAEHQESYPEAQAIGLRFEQVVTVLRPMRFDGLPIALLDHAEFSGVSFASSSALSSTDIFRA
jgi:hypothetical protein